MLSAHSSTPRATALFAATLLLAGSVFGPPAAAQTFSPPEEPRHYMPERGYDLRHLRLDLAFDWEKKEVSGTATNTLAPLRSDLDHLEFHAVDLVVTRVRLRAASAPANEPGDELPFSLDPAAQTLTVHLGHPHAPGEVLEVAIDYTAHPRTGLYFVGPDAAYPDKPRQIYSQGEPDLNRHWFPSWDAPNDRATSELFATVKKPFQVIGNGALVEVLDRPDGTRTFHWRMDQPHPTYLTSVVVGDFARVADAWQGVPVEYYVPPGREAEARAAIGRTPEMMGYFSEVTGLPYPFAKYAQSFVYDFPWGGMENITATTQTERALHPADQNADFPSDDLVSHELAHQWFGDLISCRSWDQTWLSEGFADYFAALWAGHAYGSDAFTVAIDKLREGYLAEAEGDYRRPIVTLRYTDPIRMFDAHSYQKGALVLHMVRSLVGEDAWWHGLREYVRRYAGQTVTTADFQSVMEEVSGVPLGPVIDQYVLGAGHPELEVRWEWRPETRQVHVTVEQRQRITEETGLFSFPVEIALLGEHGTGEVTERAGLEARHHQDIYLPSETRPRTVVFDPHGWMLKTLDFRKPLDEWIAQLESAPEPAARLDAIRALGALGGGMARGEAEAALGRTLHSTAFYGLRRAAADALGALGTEAALRELQAGLGTSTPEPDSRVRTAVLGALKKFPKHKELIPLLGRALEADRSFAARAAAAGALGAFRSERKEVTPLLLRSLAQKSPRDLVLAVSLAALAELDAPQTVEEAERYARYGAPDGARGRAMLSLARYTARQKDAKTKEDVRLVLESYLDDPVYRIRREVYTALAALGDPAAIPALERSAHNEVDGEQRGRVEAALHALRAAKGAGGGGGEAVAGGLAGRVEQLERESDVLKARIEELEGKH